MKCLEGENRGIPHRRHSDGTGRAFLAHEPDGHSCRESLVASVDLYPGKGDGEEVPGSICRFEHAQVQKPERFPDGGAQNLTANETARQSWQKWYNDVFSGNSGPMTASQIDYH